MKSLQRWQKSALWLVLALICAASMWFYTEKIYGLGQPPNFSDLYARWWGSHEALLHRRNPYSVAVTHEIQTVIYGAPASSRYPGDPSEIAGGFAYPLYTSFFFWPIVFTSFSTARIVFLWSSMLAVLVSIALWLRQLRFELPLSDSLTIALFAFGSFPVLQGLKLENLSLAAAAIIAIAAFLFTTGRLLSAGAVLAVATFKPQFTILLVPWLAIWVVSDWRQRGAMAWGFLASMFVLILSAEWLVPGWIGDFLRVARAYREYTPGNSPLDLWFTRPGGAVAALVLVLALFALAWPHRRDRADTSSMLVLISLFLAATLIIIPTLEPHAQVLLLPGLLCLLRYRIFLSTRLARLALTAVWILLAWPWIASCSLAIAAMLLPVTALSRYWLLPLDTTPVFPLAVTAALVFLVRKLEANTTFEQKTT
jgi:hypothetical protein